MKVKITKEGGYRCAPEGHTTITIPFGAVVEGKVAEWAIADKAGYRIMEKKSPKTKNAGAAPENKAARR